MPWTGKEFKKKHNKDLTPKQAKQAAAIANETRERTGSDARAVRTANAVMKHGKGKKRCHD